MNNLTLMSEAAAQAGYYTPGFITSSPTGQDAINKTRAQRRINVIKADLVSRFGGRWPSNYREGWLALTPVYQTGTALFTLNSRTVTGSGTTWTTAMKGRKIMASDGAFYKIASVASSTSIILTEPYQGVTTSGYSYLIWQDEYTLYPEVLSVGGFVDYSLPAVMDESWQKAMKTSYPKQSSQESASPYVVIGRQRYLDAYSTGTVSGSANSNILTGAGTSWMDNIKPGYEITIGSYTYHVARINSDTEIELYQQLVSAVSALTAYSSKGKNAITVRFKGPTSQQIVHYWYWGKDYPFVNDNDEDWVAEQFPKVLINGMTYYDYIDKNDPVRADRASIAYENSVKDMKTSEDNAYTGTRTLGLNIPSEARE
jgi:hypothetical protein